MVYTMKVTGPKLKHNKTLHHKMALDDIGNSEKGLLLNTQEMEYVNKFLQEHPDYEGRIKKKSPKSPDSELRYSVIVVTDTEGQKQAYAIYDKVLGEGAYGKVKIYQNIQTGESVATKSIRETGRNPDEKRIIEREIAVLKEIGELHGTYSRTRVIDSKEAQVNYLIMKLGFGIPLEKALFVNNEEDKSPHLDVFDQTISESARQQNLLNQVDIGLEVIRECLELHEQGYINRDIKVGNFLWDDKLKRAKMIDHGFDITMEAAEQTKVALLKRAQDEPLSAEEERLIANAFVGTPPYMAPEIWMSQGASDKTDFYAIGIVLANIMSIYEKESQYGFWEDEEGELQKDITVLLKKILAAGKDEELIELYAEIYEDGSHLLSPPELQIMANLIRGLTHEDPEQRISATLAYTQLIELKSTLLTHLKHADNKVFHEIKSELEKNIALLRRQAKAETHTTQKGKLNEEEKIMTELLTLTNLLASSYPLDDTLLMRFKVQLDEAVLASAGTSAAFASNIRLMETAYTKVAKKRNLLDNDKENIVVVGNGNTRRPAPLKTQFEQMAKKGDLRKAGPSEDVTQQIAPNKPKKPKV